MSIDSRKDSIKVFERKGGSLELPETIMRKGSGRDEFTHPAFCFYNRNEEKFVVVDYGYRKVFIYDRIGRAEIILKLAIYCLALGFNIQGNEAYFVWEGDLQIIKINIKSQTMITLASIFPLFLFPYERIHCYDPPRPPVKPPGKIEKYNKLGGLYNDKKRLSQ